MPWVCGTCRCRRARIPSGKHSSRRRWRRHKLGRNEIMENFTYHRPTSVADAVKAIKAATDGKFLAGGMTLIPTMKLGLASPSDIIDLGGLKNSGVSAAGGKVIVKAGTTHQEVASDANVKGTIPALATLASSIG